MQTILLDTGTTALSTAIAEGLPLKVAAYHIGSAANFTPTTSAPDVVPTPPVYIGDASTISPSVVASGNAIRYCITLLESVGPFNVGNIMLFVTLGDDPTLIPYLFGVLPIPVPKYPSNPPLTIGDRLVFNMEAKYVNIQQAFTLDIVTPEYSSLPNYGNEFDLPAPDNAVYQQSVLQNLTLTGAPATVVRRVVDNVWYVNPFYQRLDDPDYGTLSGGIVGDNYTPFLGDIYNGGLFTLPPGDFTDTLSGGTAWEAATGEPVCGGSFSDLLGSP